MTTSFLDAHAALQSRVGYGMLGVGGRLGYEGKEVVVWGQTFEHALSAHAPARILYHLGGTSTRFQCSVAFNDDVAGSSAWADFAVVADGREIAAARGVFAGEPPRALAADIAGAQLLELVVTTTHWDSCHTLWLEPRVDGTLNELPTGTLVDCLGFSRIGVPPALPVAERCIATLVSPGYEQLLDDMLGSVVANGGCPDAQIVVFLLGTSPACEQVVGKYRAIPVRCRPVRPIIIGSKAILYSAARVLSARRILCLDADTLVLDELGPLFAALDVCRPDAILVGRESHEANAFRDLTDALERIYGGQAGDVERILGEANGEGSYPLVLNDGVFAGTREALLALDATLRAMPGTVQWLNERADITWRNQFLFNLALARLGSGVELDPTNNLQTHTAEVEVHDLSLRPEVRWQGRRVRILHSSGSGRHRHPQLRGLYGDVAEPIVGPGDGDGYAQFLAALRPWLGRHGVPGLAQTFYGAQDGQGAPPRDPSTFPVLALLHYVIRASGCVRVFETGTANGVSAACMAAAVAHRPGGRVVTYDTHAYPGAEQLWSALPESMRGALEPRRGDSLAGLRAALDAGERYDAALLDSVHTEEHLWAEFELATQLVRPGAPILAHDWRWLEGIQRALDRIAAAGYGVVRLLGPGAVEEERGLGLALIENRS